MSETKNLFVELGLAPELVQAVADLGYTEPTLVQQAVIPKAMKVAGEGQTFIDLMVSSQTGSGKTAAFLLPVLHTLLEQQDAQEAQDKAEWDRQVQQAAAEGKPEPKRAKRKNPLLARHFQPVVPGALILCPTRELAQQVAHDAIGLVKHCRGLRVATVMGGMPYQMQIAKLQNANLVVATPGRLLDLQRSGQIKLNEIKFLVVDEADRMLDLGFSDDLAEVNQLTIQRDQTMMFSATFAPRIQALATRVMRTPQKIQIDSPQDRHSNIEQQLFWCDSPEHKRKLLDHWLRDSTIDQAIVFASTQIECDALAEDLQQTGMSAVALHGALSQGLRNRRLMALRTGQVQILVATDVAARGIDVPTITHVFNYGLPMKAEDYVHRIGRTGRAGRQGLAVTMAEFRDRRKIGEIESYSQQPIKTQTIEGLEPRKAMHDFRNDRNDRGGDRRGGFGRPSGGRPGGGGGGGGFRGYGNPSARPGAPRGGQDGPRMGFGQNVGGGKPSFGERDRPAFGDRPALGAKPGFGKPSFGKPAFGKPAFAGDRREGGPARHHDKPRGDRFERSAGDRSERPSSGGFGDKRRGGPR